MFSCPYAQTYPLWARIVGHTPNNFPLTWIERFTGYPIPCRSQIYLTLSIYILILILILILIWFKFLRKRRDYFYSNKPPKKI